MDSLEIDGRGMPFMEISSYLKWQTGRMTTRTSILRTRIFIPVATENTINRYRQIAQLPIIIIKITIMPQNSYTPSSFISKHLVYIKKDIIIQEKI